MKDLKYKTSRYLDFKNLSDEEKRGLLFNHSGKNVLVWDLDHKPFGGRLDFDDGRLDRYVLFRYNQKTQKDFDKKEVFKLKDLAKAIIPIYE